MEIGWDGMAHQLHPGEWNAKDMHTEAEETVS